MIFEENFDTYIMSIALFYLFKKHQVYFFNLSDLDPSFEVSMKMKRIKKKRKCKIGCNSKTIFFFLRISLSSYSQSIEIEYVVDC